MNKDKNEKDISPIQLSKEMLSYIPSLKGKMIISITLACIGEILGFISYFYAGYVATAFITNSIDINKIIYYGILTSIIIGIRFLLTWKSSTMSHGISYNLLCEFRKKISEKLENTQLGYIKDTGHIVSVIIERVSILEDWVAHIIPEFPSRILHPILATIILFILDYRIGLAIFIPLPFMMIGFYSMFHNQQEKSKIWLNACAKVHSTTIEYVKGISVVKAFGQENKSYSKFLDASTFYYTSTLEWWKQSWFAMAIIFAFMETPIIGTLPVAIYLYSHSLINVTTLVLSIILPLTIIPNIFQLLMSLEIFNLMKTSWQMIKEIMQLPGIKRPNEVVQLDNNKSYEFKNVNFSYEKGIQVLKDISFSINKNEIVAIVGESGSGKSTISKLMASFFEIDSGQILYGGHNIKDIPLNQLMNEIAYVTQNNFLFNTTIEENLKIAKPNATEQEIKEALYLANCDDLIKRLPNGIKSNVGDYGNLFSGGEKQRFTLARAILKNANCIILDEATAFADPENEYEIQNTLSKLVKDKTLIVIAHRLNTIINANKIIVLNNGEIVGIGTHDELIKNSNEYKKLWENYTGNFKVGEK